MTEVFIKSQDGNKRTRAVLKSKTFQGIAAAMADQWTQEEFDCMQLTMFDKAI